MARRPSVPMMITSPTGFTALSTSLLLIFSSSFLLQAQGTSNRSSEESYVPVPVPRVVYRSMVTPAGMTTPAEAEAEAPAPALPMYEPFVVCQECTCCDLNNLTNCVDVSCCSSANCDLPGMPFGTCAIEIYTCGCDGGANNCTSPPPAR